MNSELCNFLTCQYSSSSFNSTAHMEINTVSSCEIGSPEATGEVVCRGCLERYQKPYYYGDVNIWSVWWLSGKVSFLGLIIWLETHLTQ